MRKLIILLLVFLNISAISFAQKPTKLNSAEIYESIKKLNFLGSVLYVAAHPDDENTRLISYMSNQKKARTAYLSITRGDGGQNLVGPEITELLGVIRTQELLTARKIDGGEQMFTRAIDFGYSKHPDETLKIWDKDKVLNDVVLAIRKFKPDVIINRFDHRSPGSTHGHHTSSALLSLEAFDISNDATKYPDQLAITNIWQTKRIFFNTSWWFYGSQENFDKADKTNLLSIDVGAFYPTLGLSNTEIASLSRSQHKSQGFGNTGTRGETLEYIELIKGDLPEDKTNIFEGIDTSWNRVKGGNEIGAILKKVQDEFDFRKPSASVPDLVKAYTLIQKLKDVHWKSIKTKEIKNIIAACTGLYMEAVSETSHATIKDNVKLSLEVINRSNQPIQLESIINPNEIYIKKNIPLLKNVDYKFEESISFKSDQPMTSAYWLSKKGTLGMYEVENKADIGKPEKEKDINVTFNLIIENTKIPFIKEVVYKMNDPVKGEVYKPFEIIPEVSVKIDEKVIIFENDQQKEIPVTVKAGKDAIEGYVTLCSPDDWNVYPEKQKLSIANKDQEQILVFTVIPPKNQSEGLISPIAYVGEKEYSKELIDIDYDHIPFQTVLLPSESKVVRLDLKKAGENIGYIEGAGDTVPASLQQIGYNVVSIKPEDISPENLQRFDAIVVGIRAYNTVDELKFKQKYLFDYVNSGGNLIVQYNTNFRLKVDELAPYDLELSRDRVTDENAEVRILNPQHSVLNYPNKITSKDFDGWVQERGLYFPDKWSEEFTPLLSINDIGETPKDGSLLIAQYGKGYYIYTGLSFFREFPAGVAGAYRLFANMLSIGNEDIKVMNKIKN